MAQRSDDEASTRDQSFSDRYQTHFERWAHGRIPAWARPALDPRVVVQQTFNELARDGGWGHPDDRPRLDHVRRALYQNVLTRVRQVALEIAREDAAIVTVLPLRDQTIEHDLLRRYEAGLHALSGAERDAIVARTEMALPWSHVAHLLKAPDDRAARLTVSRALIHLAREMAHERFE